MLLSVLSTISMLKMKSIVCLGRERRTNNQTNFSIYNIIYICRSKKFYIRYIIGVHCCCCKTYRIRIMHRWLPITVITSFLVFFDKNHHAQPTKNTVLLYNDNIQNIHRLFVTGCFHQLGFEDFIYFPFIADA